MIQHTHINHNIRLETTTCLTEPDVLLQNKTDHTLLIMKSILVNCKLILIYLVFDSIVSASRSWLLKQLYGCTMVTRTRLLGWIFGFALLVFSSGAAKAVTVYLDENNGSLSNTPFAQVDIVPVGDDIQITVDLLAPDYEGLDIETVAFNSSFVGPALTIGNITEPTGWVLVTDVQMSIFGEFDYALACCTSGGTGTGDDPIVFLITGVVGDTVDDYSSKLSTGNGMELFALKTSAGGAAGPFVAGSNVVPIPAALPLFASGLIALGFLARRKRKGIATAV